MAEGVKRWRLPAGGLARIEGGARALLPALALAALLLWLGAQLSALLAPGVHRWRGLAEPAPQAAAGVTAQAHWFGEPPPQTQAALPPVRLIGVYAPSRPGVRGFAVIDLNGRSQLLLQGASTAEGWQLVRLDAHGVTLRSAAGEEQHVPLLARNGGGGVAGAVPRGQPSMSSQSLEDADTALQLPVPQPAPAAAMPSRQPQTSPQTPPSAAPEAPGMDNR